METRSNQILVGGVVIALLAALVAFLVWLAGINNNATKEYDIFFRQSVEGLNKGSSVSFAGVPSGQVKEIQLWKPNPEFVRVRISVDEDLPVLIGTTASIQGVGFTGVSQIQLTGAVKGAPPITEVGPAGVPTIPTKAGGLGALLNNAPQLVERLSTLTERLTEVLSDENQKSFGNTLTNIDRLTANIDRFSGNLARSGPGLEKSINEAQVTLRAAAETARRLGDFAGSANSAVNDDVRPMIADLRKTVAAAERSMGTLDAALAEARPAMRTLSTDTLPEVNQLVHDLRAVSQSLGSVTGRIESEGAGALLGGPKLPDYKPKGDK